MSVEIEITGYIKKYWINSTKVQKIMLEKAVRIGLERNKPVKIGGRNEQEYEFFAEGHNFEVTVESSPARVSWIKVNTIQPGETS